MSTHIPTGPGRWWSDEELAEHDAALVAERNAARDQLEALVEAGVADRIGGRYEVSGVLDAAREQLAAAETVIEKALLQAQVSARAFDDMNNFPLPVIRILSAYKSEPEPEPEPEQSTALEDALFPGLTDALNRLTIRKQVEEPPC